jgi:hypothetical protein
MGFTARHRLMYSEPATQPGTREALWADLVASLIGEAVVTRGKVWVDRRSVRVSA